MFANDPQRPDYILGQSVQPSNFSEPDSQLNPAAFSFTGPVGGRPGTLGRNTETGPAFFQWDISLQKRFDVSERFKLEFRSDLFNILNHANFNNPSSVLCNSYSSSGNVCVTNPFFGRSTSTLSNLIGSGSKVTISFPHKS